MLIFLAVLANMGVTFAHYLQVRRINNRQDYINYSLSDPNDLRSGYIKKVGEKTFVVRETDSGKKYWEQAEPWEITD